jgi:hypothetical protein
MSRFWFPSKTQISLCCRQIRKSNPMLLTSKESPYQSSLRQGQKQINKKGSRQIPITQMQKKMGKAMIKSVSQILFFLNSWANQLSSRSIHKRISCLLLTNRNLSFKSTLYLISKNFIHSHDYQVRVFLKYLKKAKKNNWKMMKVFI